MKFRKLPVLKPGLKLYLSNPPQTNGYYGNVELIGFEYGEWNVKVLTVDLKSRDIWFRRTGSIFHFLPQSLRRAGKPI